MSLIIICGLDRTGKTSVASYFEAKGFELVHQSAPAKGITADSYLEEQIQLVSRAAHTNIVLDRSYYGECCIWPQVYGRESLLSEEGLEVLRELEESVGTARILMFDPNVEAHWKRCVDNKEPLTKPQFVRARTLYSAMADKYGFERKTLRDYKDIVIEEPTVELEELEKSKPPAVITKLTSEQMKLETANAINEVLGKRIVKQKGLTFDKIENNLRIFLNTELGKILGTKNEIQSTGQFSTEEVELLHFFCKKLKENQK